MFLKCSLINLVVSIAGVCSETPGGGGYLGQGLLGYVPLASQNPYPIILIVYSVAS